MEASYINPAFPSVVGSRQTPPPGVRAELFLYRATGNYYLWTVPPGVYYAKVTVVGGAGGTANPSTGGTTSFGNIISATGGTNANSPGGCCTTNCDSTTGSYSVSVARTPQLIGPSHDSLSRYIRGYGFAVGTVSGNSCAGGQGVVYLQNLVPGTTFRITIGAAGSGGAASANGCCLVEY